MGDPNVRADGDVGPQPPALNHPPHHPLRTQHVHHPGPAQDQVHQEKTELQKPDYIDFDKRNHRLSGLRYARCCDVNVFRIRLHGGGLPCPWNPGDYGPTARCELQCELYTLLHIQ